MENSLVVLLLYFEKILLLHQMSTKYEVEISSRNKHFQNILILGFRFPFLANN
jgi:hypothetical protein